MIVLSLFRWHSFLYYFTDFILTLMQFHATFGILVKPVLKYKSNSKTNLTQNSALDRRCVYMFLQILGGIDRKNKNKSLS